MRSNGSTSCKRRTLDLTINDVQLVDEASDSVGPLADTSTPAKELGRRTGTTQFLDHLRSSANGLAAASESPVEQDDEQQIDDWLSAPASLGGEVIPFQAVEQRKPSRRQTAVSSSKNQTIRARLRSTFTTRPSFPQITSPIRSQMTSLTTTQPTESDDEADGYFWEF